MKKILFGVCLFFLFSVNVEAASVSLSNVKDKLKSSDLYSEFAQDGVNCNITSSNSALDITCNLTDGSYKTHFDLKKGTLYYQYDGSRSSSNTYEEVLFDDLWIVQVTDVVADFYGINIGDSIYKQATNLFSNTYNFNEHGVEFTYFEYNTGTEYGKAIDTFKLYVNDGSVSESNDNNSSNNVSTGSSIDSSKPDTETKNDTTNNLPSDKGADSSDNKSQSSSNNNSDSSTNSNANTNSNSNSNANSNSNSNTSIDSSNSSNSDNKNENSTVSDNKKDNNEILDIFFSNLGKKDDNSSPNNGNSNVGYYIVIVILILIIIVTFFIGQKPKKKD